MTIETGELPPRPRPEIPPEHAPYWAALLEHRLVAQQCADCGKLRLYPRPMCDACYSLEFAWVTLSGQGTVHSWAVSHHPFHPAFKRDVPYLTVTVDLAEGLRLHAPMRDLEASAMQVGLPVRVDFDDVEDDLTLPCFRPAD